LAGAGGGEAQMAKDAFDAAEEAILLQHCWSFYPYAADGADTLYAELDGHATGHVRFWIRSRLGDARENG
jgi:hypothetical protein